MGIPEAEQIASIIEKLEDKADARVGPEAKSASTAAPVLLDLSAKPFNPMANEKIV